MKKFNKIIVGLSILIICASCEDFLEVDEVGKTSIPTFFSDMDGIRAAVPGAYSTVYKYYDSEFYLYPQVAGDLLNLNSVGDDVKMVSQFNFESVPEQESSAVGHIWLRSFEAMANVNNIIEYQPMLVEKFPNDKEELNTIKAQALFLRALINFDLVRTYAQTYSFTENAEHIGIPVLTKSPGADDNPARKKVSAVYDQILTDLSKAEDLFKTQEDPSPYFASKIAVRALFARVFLYMENWQEAKKYSKEVMDESSLTTTENYVKMFRTREAGKEAIFRLNGKLKKSSVGSFYALSGPVAYASEKLMNIFNDTTDIRLKLLDQKYEGAKYRTLKYSRPDVSESEYGQDLFVLRTSEIVLINAEASAELDELENAKKSLKMIQARALGKPTDSIEISSNSKKEVLNLIEIERMKELCFEGHRFFDITRRHQNLDRDNETSSSVKGLNYPNSLFILPIPLIEMNANKNMIQNDGY